MMNKEFHGSVERTSMREDGQFTIHVSNTSPLFKCVSQLAVLTLNLTLTPSITRTRAIAYVLFLQRLIDRADSAADTW